MSVTIRDLLSSIRTKFENEIGKENAANILGQIKDEHLDLEIAIPVNIINKPIEGTISIQLNKGNFLNLHAKLG